MYDIESESDEINVMSMRATGADGDLGDDGGLGRDVYDAAAGCAACSSAMRITSMRKVCRSAESEVVASW